MKSIYIQSLRIKSYKEIKQIFGETFKFAIGVKGGAYSVEELMKKSPQIKIVKQFKEIVNVNYLEEFNSPSLHILQPVILRWEDNE